MFLFSFFANPSVNYPINSQNLKDKKADLQEKAIFKVHFYSEST